MTSLIDRLTAATHPIVAATEPCPDCPDDPHFGSTNTSVTDKQWDGAASRFTDEQYKRAAAACDAGDSPPKTACFLPHHEPDGTTNRNGVHAAAQRVGALKGHDAGAVARAKAHLRAHYRQMKEDAPDGLTADGAPAVVEHDVEAAAHDHPHDELAPGTSDAATTGAIPGFGRWATEAFVRRGTGTGDGPVVAAAAVAGHLVEFGSPIGVASDHPEDGPWQVLTAAGAGWTVDSYADAVQRVAEEMAATPDRPVLAERWRSVMAFEGVSTGDGRRIADGAIEYRPTPLPLMLQTVTEGGHFGAVLAGSIEETGKVGSRAVGAGCFFDFDAGRQFAQIIAGQGRFGVSIDVAESEGEFVCTETNPDGECVDGEVLFSLIRVMGVTGTPFPAFEGAYIEFDTADAAGQPVAAAATWVEAGNVTSVLTFSTTTNEAPALVAAGGPAFAPASAFDDPKLTGPTRLRVERLDGGLTRIYGHLATWDRCHTGYADRCVRPPRSPSGYAFFNDGPLPTSDGKIVHVGQITMGCGHADTNPRLSASAVKAHYDGGPGAKVVADVHVGEDRVGIWYSGVVRPDVTDDELRHFQATKRSGDWRNVERGKGIDLVAILGDVPVPGFPVHEPVAASASPVAEAVTARYADGVLAVLVASFTVDEPEAWQVAIAERDDVIAEMRDRLAAVERIARPLRPIAAAAIIDAAVGADL